MIHAGKLALAVVGGGTLMGTLLGSFADPVMKPGPESPLGGLAEAPLQTGARTAYIEPLPEDLSPPTVPDGYAPAIAFTELPELSQVDFPEPQFPEYEDGSYASWAEPEAVEPELEAPVTGSTKTEFVEVAEVALAAEDVVEDALAARAAPDRAGERPRERPRLDPLY